jgi:hypothetical protein
MFAAGLQVRPKPEAMSATPAARIQALPEVAAFEPDYHSVDAIERKRDLQDRSVQTMERSPLSNIRYM